ncbi:hypothetical protein [Acidovorax delafieldii]|uniref:hypothetical protein n=1 Tax=Acidovorax delafieldii TaxID=47920 RepID=UPI0002FB9FE6|nr:hypothetical protein [Acidovorax delafieldii]
MDLPDWLADELLWLPEALEPDWLPDDPPPDWPLPESLLRSLRQVLNSSENFLKRSPRQA